MKGVNKFSTNLENTSKFIGARKMTGRKAHNGDPQILGAMVKI
jgi:hypothetical protein